MEQKVIVFGVDGLIPELIYKFSEEGNLPNISHMLENGSSAELLPFISTWGDVNWVSFLTGQFPGTCWKGQSISPDHRHNLLGSMERAGKKCALVHFPESVSVAGTGHFQFAPFWSGNGSAPFELASPTIYSTHPDKWPIESKSEHLGWPPVGTLAYHEKGNYQTLHQDSRGHYLLIRLHNGSRERVEVAVTREKGTPGVRLTFRSGETVEVQKGRWSPWKTVHLAEDEAFVQFKLLTCDAASGEIDLLQSQLNRTQGYSNDVELERAILEHSGPFISKWTVPATPGGLYSETSYEEGEYQAQWLAKTALMLINERKADLFATVFRLNDETHHTSLGEYDPSSPFYSADRAILCEETMRKSYVVLDRAIGRILQDKTEETILILASDHGDVPNGYLCDIYQRLAEFGLCRLDSSGLPLMGQSQAYLKNERGGLEVFVNLKGREPQGIVDASDYERVQTEIYRALTTWYHQTPKGNENVVGVALKKRDAVMIGYWGEEMGDIIFAYNQGFVWGHNNHRDVVAPISKPSANHGPQIPTAATGFSSNYGIALFHGSNVRKGIRRDRLAPYRMNDAGATIARILGISEFNGIEGRPMKELFQWE